MIPNLFSKQEIPEKIPKSMQRLVDKINRCKTKEGCLRIAYGELTKTHSGAICGVWKHFPSLFVKDINKLWSRRKLQCIGLSFLLRVLLIKSRHFTENDVRYKRKIICFVCPHVFLKVNTGKKWVDVDVWAKAAGVPFGKHADSKSWFSNFLGKK